jgi:hypothetical protein
MAPTGPVQDFVRRLVNAVPDGEESAAVLPPLEVLIQLGEHLVGTPHVRPRQGAGANHIADGDRQQRRVEAVPVTSMR